MPHTFINGFSGTAVFASYTFDVTEWTLNVNAEALDTTNTSDAGWETNITGAKSWDGSCKSFWDTGTVPTGATAGLLPGSSGTVTLNVGNSGKSYVGTCRITQIVTGNPVKGVVSFDLNFKGTGALTYPS